MIHLPDPALAAVCRRIPAAGSLRCGVIAHPFIILIATETVLSARFRRLDPVPLPPTMISADRQTEDRWGVMPRPLTFGDCDAPPTSSAAPGIPSSRSTVQLRRFLN
jgi:hypothetical protein